MCCREWSAVNSEDSWGGWGGIRSHWQVSGFALSCCQYINEQFVCSQLQLTVNSRLNQQWNYPSVLEQTTLLKYNLHTDTWPSTVQVHVCGYRPLESDKQFVVMVLVVQKLRLGCGSFLIYTCIIYNIKNVPQPKQHLTHKHHYNKLLITSHTLQGNGLHPQTCVRSCYNYLWSNHIHVPNFNRFLVPNMRNTLDSLLRHNRRLL